ncbi:DUF3048 domain-containing protein [Gracilibacillus massiliensis]|uniref:DUF3048 domain-containing protein n=1 Tax=Gracilibacillus massiliensis TaxID=1564956 RepID=UPI00071D8BE1|nr:DUF3048 domain-containing protein [Gracilibacillus massiliensis]
MKKLLFVIFILLFSLVACSDDETTTEPEPEEEPVEEVEEELEEPEKPSTPEHIYPLTGMEAEEKVTDRMIAVMVNNHPKARPQTGLSQADTVFEILAEGNITRLMAIFQSDIPERVGPVRSARPYYFNLADDYNAIYVYHGAANFIEDMIQNGAAQGLNGMYYDNDKVLFERSSDRVAPHNSYALFDGIYQRAEEQEYPLEAEYQPLTFIEEDQASEGETATDVQFSYSNYSVRYVYDQEKKSYERYSDGVQTVEKTDSTPIMLENVLIMETPHQVIDDAGRREIDLESGGNALLLQQGKVQHVQWERIDGRIIPTKDGEPVPFVSGQTWVNVIPTSPGIDGVQLSSETE